MADAEPDLQFGSFLLHTPFQGYPDNNFDFRRYLFLPTQLLIHHKKPPKTESLLL